VGKRSKVPAAPCSTARRGMGCGGSPSASSASATVVGSVGDVAGLLS
jgi:hypothetical protein